MIAALVDGQFGSTGKGLIAGYLAGGYHVHVRVGAANAGHTVYVDRDRHVLQQLPCAAYANPWAKLVIGAGAMISAEILVHEVADNAAWRELRKLPPLQLYIDERAHVVTGGHVVQEARTDLAERIGSTSALAREGIGAAQAARVMRTGYRLAKDDLRLRGLSCVWCDTVSLLHDAKAFGQNVLLEGTQGTGLDNVLGYAYPHCVHQDGQVDVWKRGRNSLSGVQVGERIWDGQRWSRVLSKWESEQPAYVVRTDDRDLVVSAQHRHIVWRDDREIEVSTLELRPDDLLPIAEPQRAVSTAPIQDPHFWYLVGYLIGDGWLTEQKGHYAALWAGNDLRTVCRSLDSLGIQHRVWHPEPGAVIQRVRVGLQAFSEELAFLGLRRRSAHKLLPQGFEHLDQWEFGALLAGLIDSDGNLTNAEKTAGTRIKVHVSSYGLVQQLQSWFDQHDLRTAARFSLLPDQNAKHWRGRGRAGYRKPMYRWECVLDGRFRVLADALQAFSRKAAAIDFRVSWRERRRETDRAYRRRGSKKGWVKVKRVWAPGFDQKMVDLETVTQRFAVGGLVTHNCTSRHVTASGLAADCGLGPRDIDTVYLVVRTFPIRVAGKSGPFWRDSREIQWSDIGVDEQKEKTTVTQRVRRVATFSQQQVKYAARVNSASEIALTFLDYLAPECKGRDGLISAAECDRLDRAGALIREIEYSTGVPVALLGTSPHSVMEREPPSEGLGNREELRRRTTV